MQESRAESSFCVALVSQKHIDTAKPRISWHSLGSIHPITTSPPRPSSILTNHHALSDHKPPNPNNPHSYHRLPTAADNLARTGRLIHAPRIRRGGFTRQINQPRNIRVSDPSRGRWVRRCTGNLFRQCNRTTHQRLRTDIHRSDSP